MAAFRIIEGPRSQIASLLSWSAAGPAAAEVAVGLAFAPRLPRTPRRWGAPHLHLGIGL
jgi:hypothetical protein